MYGGISANGTPRNKSVHGGMGIVVVPQELVEPLLDTFESDYRHVDGSEPRAFFGDTEMLVLTSTLVVVQAAVVNSQQIGQSPHIRDAVQREGR